MKDGDIGGCEFVEAHRLAHGLAAEVHEGHGFEQDDARAVQRALRDHALKLGAPRAKAVILGDAVERHEADVVAVPLVFRARIAETYKELHGWCPRS